MMASFLSRGRDIVGGGLEMPGRWEEAERVLGERDKLTTNESASCQTLGHIDGAYREYIDVSDLVDGRARQRERDYEKRRQERRRVFAR